MTRRPEAGLLVLALAGCSSPASLTELVVVVDTDLEVPDEIGRVRFEVDSEAVDGRTQTAEVSFSDRRPATLGLVHRSGPLGPVVVTAVGMGGDQRVITATARTAFVEERVMTLRLDLHAVCLGRACGDEETCGPEGTCVSIDDFVLTEWRAADPFDADADGDGDNDADADADGGSDADTEVECTEARDCADGVACTDDSCVLGECQHTENNDDCHESDEVCTLDEGCAHELWVDARCEDRGCSDDCTESAPCARISEAFSRTSEDARTNVIRILPGVYAETIAFDEDRPVLVVGGDGVLWQTTEDDVAFIADGSAVVTLRQLSISAKNNPVICRGSASCTLERVTLFGGRQFGLEVDSSATVSMSRCLVTGNLSGGVHTKSTAIFSMVNTFVVGNGAPTAKAGGLLLTDSSTNTCVNSTIADNDGGSGEGAILIEGSAKQQTTLHNLLLWNNVSTAPDQCRSCALGDDSLDGAVDPLFVETSLRSDPEHYKIQHLSPARNGGRSDPTVPTADYFGQIRDDGDPDIGADELDR